VGIRFLSRAWAVGLALSGFSSLTGCAGNGPAPAGGGSSFDIIQQTIFNVSCVSAPCHSSTSQQGNLVLEEGVSYGNLVGVAPFNDVARAMGLQRVVPDNPDMSFLLTKLTDPGPGEGSLMPLGMPPLSAADIEKVRVWILAGAPGPGGTTATSPATPTSTQTATFTPTPTASAVPTPTFSIDSTLPLIQTTIFDTTCLDIGCHNATSLAGGQSLAPGESYAQLVGVTPQNVAAVQDGLLRVTPGNPDESFLVTKITLPVVFDPRYGSRMPSGKPALSADQIEQVRAWILRGALPDETP
jgi:hypothetical protein